MRKLTNAEGGGGGGGGRRLQQEGGLLQQEVELGENDGRHVAEDGELHHAEEGGQGGQPVRPPGAAARLPDTHPAL